MKAPALFASLAVACSAMAQLPVDPTKPDPFAKFGNTGLDRRPTANTMPARPASAPMPTTSSQEAPRRKPPKGPPDGNSGPTGPGGLALAASHTGALDEAVEVRA